MDDKFPKKELNIYSVLKAFQKFGELRWGDFNTNKLFINIQPGSPRAKTLNEIMDELVDIGYLIEHDENLPAHWTISDQGAEALNEYENQEKIQEQKDKERNERSELELRKLQVDYKLAENTLKEFPATKTRAIIALIIAVLAFIATILQMFILKK